jgi:glycosyltransferase involved in cell wall biosynthesis
MDLHNQNDCVLVMYGFAQNDPPTWQAAESLASLGYRVHVIQTGFGSSGCQPQSGSVIVHTVSKIVCLRRLGPLSQFLNWRKFVRYVRKFVTTTNPRLIVTIMLHGVAALPARSRLWNYTLVSCIYDIPALDYCGRLDRPIMIKGWKRLCDAQVVWSSDIYKAELTQKFGVLRSPPLVCHNCPPRNYFPESITARDEWLRGELRSLGASIGETGGSILLRAGAIGECGGIEETLEGMLDLPEDFVFVMMGRPPESFKRVMLEKIRLLGLERRAFLFDRPEDDTWKKILRGADIGHLIHGPFPQGYMTKIHELNSSLSNNRLFQYMAAGIAIMGYDDPRLRSIYEEVPCFRVVRVSNLKQDIVERWRELGGNPSLASELGKAGRASHLEKYCWEVQFQPLIERIEELTTV